MHNSLMFFLHFIHVLAVHLMLVENLGFKLEYDNVYFMAKGSKFMFVVVSWRVYRPAMTLLIGHRFRMVDNDNWIFGMLFYDAMTTFC